MDDYISSIIGFFVIVGIFIPIILPLKQLETSQNMYNKSSDSLRVCLLVDNDGITKWQHLALKKMLSRTSAELDLVVVNQRDQAKSLKEIFKRMIQLKEWTIVHGIRMMLFQPNKTEQNIKLRECQYLNDVNRIDCVPETVEGWKNTLPHEVEKRIADKADIAIRFGFGFLIGDILDTLQYGVLSFHHGDIREYRGQPAGCWEFIHGEDKAGITLQRINENLDAGEIIMEKNVSIDDARTYNETKKILYKNSQDMLAKGITKIEKGDENFTIVDDLGKVYTIPRGVPAFRFLIKDIKGFVYSFIFI